MVYEEVPAMGKPSPSPAPESEAKKQITIPVKVWTSEADNPEIFIPQFRTRFLGWKISKNKKKLIASYEVTVDGE